MIIFHIINPIYTHYTPAMYFSIEYQTIHLLNKVVTSHWYLPWIVLFLLFVAVCFQLAILM